MKTQIEKVKVSELVEDFDLYPRAQVDIQHISQIAEAIEAGAEPPPIIVCGKTKRIVDGFHRSRALRKVFGKDAEAEVEFRHYKDDAELFLEAMRLNANHGRNMTSFDRTVAIEKATRFEIDPELVAAALNMKVDRVTAFKTERCAKIENSRRLAPLKMPIRHMAGRTITASQSSVIPKLGGNQQTFYVNQIITLIESDLLDYENEALMARLKDLKKALAKVV